MCTTSVESAIILPIDKKDYFDSPQRQPFQVLQQQQKTTQQRQFSDASSENSPAALKTPEINNGTNFFFAADTATLVEFLLMLIKMPLNCFL